MVWTCLILLLLCGAIEAIDYYEFTRKETDSIPRQEHRRRAQQDSGGMPVSPYFQWETSLWPQRNIDFNVTIDVDALDTALRSVSRQTCNLGITATLFDYADAENVYQTTVGDTYNDLSQPGSPLVNGWTADTTFALYSNSKIFATTLFMKAVVEAGLGYLDEPLYRTFTYLNASSTAGRVTPRHILSHRSGLPRYNRNDDDDPFYSCIYNASLPLDGCLQEHLLVDSLMLDEPGAAVSYSNDPFYIIASLIVQKTPYSDINEALQAVIVEPLQMSNATSYECPLVGSTADKPHVSWGVCSTGKDVPKLIRELLFYDQSSLLSADSIREILSFQVGTAADADRPLAFEIPLGNCLSRRFGQASGDPQLNALIGYGLGTMITAGVKGIQFVHAATVGGYWVVAPHRYALYLAFMGSGAFPRYYSWMARIVDQLERKSTVMVKNTWDNASQWYELSPCVDGMFFDSDFLSVASRPVPCPIGFGQTETEAPAAETGSPVMTPTCLPKELGQDPAPSTSPTVVSGQGQRLLSTSTSHLISLAQFFYEWIQPV